MSERDRRDAGSAHSLFRHMIPRGGLCFDVGANRGERTAMFRSLGARVIAVEPQAGCEAHLRRRFAGDRDVEIVAAALGPAPAMGTLRIGSADTLSSLSDEWIAAVRTSGRFADHTWDATQPVVVTTLDDLVQAHGVPDFTKIDVEGYEEEVLLGMSNPVPALSFEFTRERLPSRLRSVRRLRALGLSEFNFSSGESMRLFFPAWVGLDTIVAFLESDAHDAHSFGDVYARTPRPDGQFG